MTSTVQGKATNIAAFLRLLFSAFVWVLALFGMVFLALLFFISAATR